MSKTETIDDLVATQRSTVADLEKHHEELQAELKARIEHRDAVAADETAAGAHSNLQLERADLDVQSTQDAIEDSAKQIATEKRRLSKIAKAHTAAPSGTSKTKTIDALVHDLQVSLSALTVKKGELGLALVSNPKSEEILEDIDINDEKLATITKRLGLFQEARSHAVDADKADAAAQQALSAVKSRDRAVSAAHKRVQVAAKIDTYLAGLGPLLREWREVDAEVQTATSDALRATCEGADFSTRSRRMAGASNAAQPDCISGAVAKAILKAGVTDVAKAHLRIDSNQVWSAHWDTVTAESLAQKAIPNLQARIDEALRSMEVQP